MQTPDSFESASALHMFSGISSRLRIYSSWREHSTFPCRNNGSGVGVTTCGGERGVHAYSVSGRGVACAQVFSKFYSSLDHYDPWICFGCLLLPLRVRLVAAVCSGEINDFSASAISESGIWWPVIVGPSFSVWMIRDGEALTLLWERLSL